MKVVEQGSVWRATGFASARAARPDATMVWKKIVERVKGDVRM